VSNIWNCNYPLWQGGEAQFDCSFMSHDAALPLSESARFGWDAVSPLAAQWVNSSIGPRAAAPFRFEVEPQNAMIVAVKEPEAGDGNLPRVWECAWRTSTLAAFSLSAAAPRRCAGSA
jgi:hypothetical protein